MFQRIWNLFAIALHSCKPLGILFKIKLVRYFDIIPMEAIQSIGHYTDMAIYCIRFREHTFFPHTFQRQHATAVHRRELVYQISFLVSAYCLGFGCPHI